MQLATIKIGTRHRKDLGDIDALAASINTIGLLHPVVVNSDGVLIAGRRRLEAVRRLGWSEIPATVATNLTDAMKLLQAERDENTERKDFLPTELQDMRLAMEPTERKSADLRMKAGTPSVKFTEGPKGNTLDKIAGALGVSRPTLEKIGAVVEAAREHPEAYGDLPEQMDRTRKVTPAYNELVSRASAPNAPPVRLPHKPTTKPEPSDEDDDLPPLPPGSMHEDASKDPELRATRLVNRMRGAVISFRDDKVLRDLRKSDRAVRVRVAKQMGSLVEDLNDLVGEIEVDDEAEVKAGRSGRKAG
jgi:ParB family chromosome partitioning protein